MTTLTVIMPNRNHAHFLPESLGAIFAQSHPADEVLVIDDASTDDSIAVIERFARENSRLRLIRNQAAVGVVAAMNQGIREAKGEYCYFAGADDRALPGLFEKSLALLSQFPEAAFCCSNPSNFDDITGRVSEVKTGWSAEPTYFSPAQLDTIFHRRRIGGHVAVIRRTALLEMGGFPEKTRWHADWFALLLLAFRYGVGFIPETLALLRYRDDSYSAAGLKRPREDSEAVAAMIDRLLSPECADVFPHFVKAESLTLVARSLIPTVLLRPRFWRSELKALLRPVVSVERERALRTLREVFS